MFQKGQSGNPKGGHGRAKIVTQALIAELQASDGLKLRKLINALVDKATEGDVIAMREVIDRVEGKPAQIIAGDEENPVRVEHYAAREFITRRILGKPAEGRSEENPVRTNGSAVH